MGFSLRGVEQARGQPPRRLRDRARRFDARRRQTHADWRSHFDRIAVEGGVERAAHDLRHQPLPLADQAVLRPGREPVLVDVEVVRVRHRHDVGPLQDPAPAAHGAGARPGRRAGVGAAVGARRRRATSRSATGWRGAPTASSARAARWPTPSSPTSARSACPASTGSTRSSTSHDDLRRILRRGLPREGRRPPDHPHPRPRLRLPLHGPGGPPRRRPRAGRPPRRAGQPLDQRLRPGDRSADRLRPSTRVGVWNYSFRLLHDMAARIELGRR